MIALHPFRSHHPHHFRLHYFTLRYVLPIVLALLLFFLLATPVHGQVMVDESQLHGKLPSWVDPAYVKTAPAEAPIIIERYFPPITERVWVLPVTKTISERVWVEDRYGYRTITRWMDGHFICERVLVLVEPAHFETRWREIVLVPGHWETVAWPRGR